MYTNAHNSFWNKAGMYTKSQFILKWSRNVHKTTIHSETEQIKIVCKTKIWPKTEQGDLKNSYFQANSNFSE